MIKKYLIVIGCMGLIACSRQAATPDTYSSDSFYFSTNNQLFKYDGYIESIDPYVSSFGSIDSSRIHTRNASGVSIMSVLGGDITFRHEPENPPKAVVLSEDGKDMYYITSKGYMMHYNTESNITTSLELRVYPLPKEMILVNQHIYYHDSFYVYSLNLNTKNKTKVTHQMHPIQNLVRHQPTGELYFSTSTSGKVYRVHPGNIKGEVLVYTPLSVSGSALSFDKTYSALYFTKTNGKDTTIYRMHMETGSITEDLTLFDVRYVSQLARNI